MALHKRIFTFLSKLFLSKEERQLVEDLKGRKVRTTRNGRGFITEGGSNEKHSQR